MNEAMETEVRKKIKASWGTEKDCWLPAVLKARLVTEFGKDSSWEEGDRCLIASVGHAVTGDIEDVYFDSATITWRWCDGSVKAECADGSGAIFTAKGTCRTLPDLVLLDAAKIEKLGSD